MPNTIQTFARFAHDGYSAVVRPNSLLAVAVVALVALPGCPKKTRAIPVVPEVPTTGDQRARVRFQDARARFERDGHTAVDAAAEFDAIAREYPDDPIAPYATFYAGRAAFQAGNYAEAAIQLEAVTARPEIHESLRRRNALFLGMTYGYLGRHADALRVLETAEAAVADDSERGERYAVMAEAHAQLGQLGPAIDHYQRWFPLATAAERTFIAARYEQLATTAEADGDAAVSARARAAAERARAAIGEASGARASAGGQPDIVGAALPVSGKRARVGTAAMRGIGLAAGTFDATPGTGVGVSGVPRPFTVASRDSRSSASVATDAVGQLVTEGAIAIVGPLDAAAVRAAARAAGDIGVPLVALDAVGGAQSDVDSPFVFHIVLSPEARARSLAAYAMAKGKTRFAILAPRIDYGTRIATAFRAEVEQRGGQVIVETQYAAKSTSFTKVIDTIRGKPWDALFIPDTARRLELVVPALASANLVVQPAGVRKPKHGRGIMLLSTAEALSPRYLRGSGRYSHGAVFAPGFYADRDDRVIGGFVKRYIAAYGTAPIYLDAYAYDAALVVRAAVESGAATRADVSAAIGRSAVDGLTGAVQFGANRRRSDDGLLFRVIKDVGGEYRVRALR